MAIFLGNTNSGDQNFLHMLIYHGDTLYYNFLKKSVLPHLESLNRSILTNTPVKYCFKREFLRRLLSMRWEKIELIHNLQNNYFLILSDPKQTIFCAEKQTHKNFRFFLQILPSENN